MNEPGNRVPEAAACYLGAADLAQSGRYDEAVLQFERALAMDPELHTARLQLGLLLLTMARPEAAMEAWRPLDGLPASSPIRLFKAGLEALTRDDFVECLRCLGLGMEANKVNEPLNRDMQLLVDRIMASVSPIPAPVSGQALPVRQDFSLYDEAANKE